MKTAAWTILVVVAFLSGALWSRFATLKAYPPEAVKVISDAHELMDPIPKEEQKNILDNMRHKLTTISKEFNYQALYEGMAAHIILLKLESDGENGAKDVALRYIEKFHEAYDKGFDLPDDSLEFANSLYGATKSKWSSEQPGSSEDENPAR